MNLNFIAKFVVSLLKGVDCIYIYMLIAIKVSGVISIGVISIVSVWLFTKRIFSHHVQQQASEAFSSKSSPASRSIVIPRNFEISLEVLP